MKRRIWELDAARGICLFFMFYCHIVYDLVYLFGIVPSVNDGGLFEWTTKYTGILFITMSGISATLGKRPIKRGLTVFGGGLLVSLVTYLMYKFGFAGKGLMIYFGILHCIGVCMILWPIFRKLPWWVLIPLGLAIIFIPNLLTNVRTDSYWLLPFGIYPRYFQSSDYFPLLPCFGYFLIGGGLGQILYKRKKSLLPEPRFFPFPARCFMGRHSLIIYLVHQPIVAGCIYVISILF